MKEVPASVPATTPVVPTVAASVLLLLHVPPAGVAVSVVTFVAQTTAVPAMAVGSALTVTCFDATQPESE